MDVTMLHSMNLRKPTLAEPGSPEKIAILCARAEAGLPLHHREDRKHESTPGMLVHWNESARMQTKIGKDPTGRIKHFETLLHSDYSRSSD